ncbi:gephyrin isoform X2 [Cylas formicarius]|uniref:gephyrin isoform X2 n=1 Tax=Cylas formicarius TaxID=197179 RepID=UPI002958B287|nr:gephyrin isoform X2 [Cylas formicarius]
MQCKLNKLNGTRLRDMALRFGILTVSTTCFMKVKEDVAGPKLEAEISETFPDSKVTFKRIVSDDEQSIAEELKNVSDADLCDVIFTVGGTGFAPSDVTPEATRAVIDKEALGLELALISRSLAMTEMAMLSRLACGIRKKTIILNFPGSTKAAIECFGFIKSSLVHAVELVRQRNERVADTHRAIQQNNEFTESKVKIQVGALRHRKSPYDMISVQVAQDIIFGKMKFCENAETEVVSVTQALERVLAEDISAIDPIPPFPASIKDGYAVITSDGVGQRAVKAAMAAGDEPAKSVLHSGEVIRISTGAAVPAGADAVVQIEDTTLIAASENGSEEKIIKINVAPTVGQDIRPIGSDIHAGTLVLKKYNRITAAYVGVLATLGFTKVRVIKRPTIGIISTGNELRNAGETLKPGEIRDSNKVTLLTLLKSFGYDAGDCGIARDHPNAVKATVEAALIQNDIIISTGGVSMGEYDLLKQVLIEDFHATIEFARVNMKPGKPTVFATLTHQGKKKYVFGLPGNPVSCCVTSLLFVIPALKRIELDASFKFWPLLPVKLENRIVNNDIRPEYVRVNIFQNTSLEFRAVSTGNQISSRLNSMVDANGLLLVPGKTTWEAGSVRAVHLFGQLHT